MSHPLSRWEAWQCASRHVLEKMLRILHIDPQTAGRKLNRDSETSKPAPRTDTLTPMRPDLLIVPLSMDPLFKHVSQTTTVSLTRNGLILRQQAERYWALVWRPQGHEVGDLTLASQLPCCYMNVEKRPSFPQPPHHLGQVGESVQRFWEWESWHCPSPAAVLWIPGPATHLGNTVELIPRAQVSWPWKLESGRACLPPHLLYGGESKRKRPFPSHPSPSAAGKRASLEAWRWENCPYPTGAAALWRAAPTPCL